MAARARESSIAEIGLSPTSCSLFTAHAPMTTQTSSKRSDRSLRHFLQDDSIRVAHPIELSESEIPTIVAHPA